MSQQDGAARVRVAVVFGGTSGEHPVSCLSAASVLAHLDPEQFDIVAIGITPHGGWRRIDPSTLRPIEGRRLPEVTGGVRIGLLPDPTTATLVPLAGGWLDGGSAADGSAAEGSAVDGSAAAGSAVAGSAVDSAAAGDASALDVDVVFPVLHGPMGEDGTLQGLLEMAGIPYVGPGVLASAAGMDKEFTKKLLAAEGLPIGPYAVLRPGVPTLAAADRERLGLPVFVKPARAGSSLGVSRVDEWADLDAAIAVARRADPKVLVEAAISGREIECGVLERPDGSVISSPTAEIHLTGDHAFYDFDAKYLDDVATFDIPARLEPALEAEIRELAVRAFHALDAQGLARVDFFVDAAGQVLINEVNTMPGFTSISMYPRMFGAAGIGYPELLQTLVRTAIARGTGLR